MKEYLLIAALALAGCDSDSDYWKGKKEGYQEGYIAGQELGFWNGTKAVYDKYAECAGHITAACITVEYKPPMNKSVGWGE